MSPIVNDILRFFVGARVGNPKIIVRSDAGKEILKAVRDLGWLSEASLENRWPHNHMQERWQATLKSIMRTCAYQSGFPPDAWHLLPAYASIAYSITALAPLYPHEHDKVKKRPL